MQSRSRRADRRARCARRRHPRRADLSSCSHARSGTTRSSRPGRRACRCRASWMRCDRTRGRRSSTCSSARSRAPRTPRAGTRCCASCRFSPRCLPLRGARGRCRAERARWWIALDRVLRPRQPLCRRGARLLAARRSLCLRPVRPRARRRGDPAAPRRALGRRRPGPLDPLPRALRRRRPCSSSRSRGVGAGVGARPGRGPARVFAMAPRPARPAALRDGVAARARRHALCRASSPRSAASGAFPSPFGPPVPQALFAAGLAAGAVLAVLVFRATSEDAPGRSPRCSCSSSSPLSLAASVWRPIAFAGRSEMAVLPVWIWAVARAAARDREVRMRGRRRRGTGARGHDLRRRRPASAARPTSTAVAKPRAPGAPRGRRARRARLLPAGAPGGRPRPARGARRVASRQAMPLIPAGSSPGRSSRGRTCACAQRLAEGLPPGGRLFLLLPPAYNAARAHGRRSAERGRLARARAPGRRRPDGLDAAEPARR